MDALTTPSNWQRVRLGDICYLKNGFSFKSDLFKNMGIPIIRISNISSVDNCINTNDLVFYDPILIDNDYILKQGDLILAMSGATTGKSCLYNLNKIAYLNQRVGVFRAKTSFCYDFLVQFVFSELFTSRLKLILTAGAQPNISSFDIEDFEILLPPLNEQIAIANILSGLDRYLYSLDALILKKESVKKALSFELLSQRKRLKGFNQNWQKVRLGNIGITMSGLVGKTKQDFINGNAKYITFLNVLNNVIIDTSILENVKIYPNEKQNSFKKYDLFFNTSSETPKEVGMCAVLLDDID
ncbi:restriction endonuclease subunit S, partial [Helicobacter pylori]|uniref:restriction endonuclease subunit S n=1 Tax=Helicobacter pylori TaxID=210 RepID=UPI000BE7BBC7